MSMEYKIVLVKNRLIFTNFNLTLYQYFNPKHNFLRKEMRYKTQDEANCENWFGTF